MTGQLAFWIGLVRAGSWVVGNPATHLSEVVIADSDLIADLAGWSIAGGHIPGAAM